MPRNELEPLMTVEEVAAVLRIAPKTVRNWASAGKLSRVEGLPNLTRFRRADVEKLAGVAEDEPTASAA
jgi:excisionase family DNA binding protein